MLPFFFCARLAAKKLKGKQWTEFFSSYNIVTINDNSPPPQTHTPLFWVRVYKHDIGRWTVLEVSYLKKKIQISNVDFSRVADLSTCRLGTTQVDLCGQKNSVDHE